MPGVIYRAVTPLKGDVTVFRRHYRPAKNASTNMDTPATSELVTENSSRRTTRAPAERFHSLDALRGFALLLGVFFHSLMPYVLPPGMWAVGTTKPWAPVL